MSKQTSDLLWSLALLGIGVISILTNYKKDPNYKDRFGYRLNGLIIGWVAVIGSIYAVCKILFFTSY